MGLLLSPPALAAPQVKVLSAECLHATVLYMVGKSANESDSASAASTAAKNYAQVPGGQTLLDIYYNI